MIAITGANGHLGRLVVEGLLERMPAGQIVAAVRRPEAALRLEALGVHVRTADYNRPDTLRAALHDVRRILLVSVADVDHRLPLHEAVIDAAADAGVERFVYTSLLRADRSRLFLAREHAATEDAIRQAGLPFAILRNGWYLENHTSTLGDAVARGVLAGSSGHGRFSSASRADYAAAAVAALTEPMSESRTYELAGDRSFSMDELASEVSRQVGREIRYLDLPRGEYAAVLRDRGVPQRTVDVILDADAQAIRGDLESTSRDLSGLIGRPTTTLADAVRDALCALPTTA